MRLLKGLAPFFVQNSMRNFHFFLIISIQFILSSCLNKDKQIIANSTNISDMNNFANYNFWANEQFINWLEKEEDSIFSQEVKSSFSTIRDNIFHLWHAEYGWMQALQEKEWAKPPNSNDTISNRELLYSFIDSSRELTDYVQSLDHEMMSRKISLSSEREVHRNDILLHVFNHSTFHRGQIITIARNLGLETFPRTDYIYYLSLDTSVD